MALLNLPWDRCWCFRTVRAGSIASAIYAVIIALLRIAGSIVEEVVVSAEKFEGNATMLQYEQHSAEVVFGYIEFAMAVLILTAGICLLIGIFGHKSVFLIPFIVMFSLICGMEALFAVLMILGLILFPSLGMFIILMILLISLFVDASCTLCVISHFMNLRAGRESMRAVYRSQGERLGDADEEEAALPSKGPVPTDSTMRFTTSSDVPVSSFEDAPPPYRDI